VKPANLGSSVGVAPADDVTSLDAALADAASYDEWVVVEEAVTGREIELAVLGDRVPQVSGPGEIRPGDAFYSYADKYETDDAELLTSPISLRMSPWGSRRWPPGHSSPCGVRAWPGWISFWPTTVGCSSTR